MLSTCRLPLAGLYPEQLLGSGPCTGHGSLSSGGCLWLTEDLISLGEIELKTLNIQERWMFLAVFAFCY